MPKCNCSREARGVSAAGTTVQDRKSHPGNKNTAKFFNFFFFYFFKDKDDEVSCFLFFQSRGQLQTNIPYGKLLRCAGRDRGTRSNSVVFAAAEAGRQAPACFGGC